MRLFGDGPPWRKCWRRNRYRRGSIREPCRLTCRGSGMNGTDEPRFRLGLARVALAWEQIWPALWPATGVAGLFIAIALFNVLPSLGGWLHALILLLFAMAFGAAVWYGVRRIRLPDGAAALRRLERDSGLTHRPLAVLRDTMAGGSDPASAELWRLYQERGRPRIGRPQGRAA